MVAVMSRSAPLAVLAAVLAGPAAAEAGRRDVGASIIVVKRSGTSLCAQCGPYGTPVELATCDWQAIAQMPRVSGAVGYTAVVKDNVLGERTFNGPPFYDNQDGWTTPSGVHWFGLSGGGGSGNCEGADAEVQGRYSIRRAFVTTDGKTRIAGTLSGVDGKAVPGQRVVIAGPTRTRARTDASGSYSVLVRKGTYRVTAPRGFCAAGARTCTNLKTLRVSGTATADFARRTVELSGSIGQHECGTGCTASRPLPGATVTATGGAGTVSTTSDADGKWSLSVATGTWTVTPSFPRRDFEPKEKKVDARRDTGGLHFETCASDPAQIRGVATMALTIVGSCDPDGIDWTMPEHFKGPGNWNPATYLPKPLEIYPKSWTANLFLTKGGKAVGCRPGTRWVWRVAAPAGVVRSKPERGCKGKLEVTRLGTYPVTVRKEVLEGGRWRNAGSRIDQSVVVKDWLVVGMGDSNGSGEGNPSTFFFKRCNRGTASYQYQTAAQIEEADERSSVTFVFSSCSGASIQHLTNSSYEGVRPRKPPLPAQTKQVNQVLKHTNRGPGGAVPLRKVDVVLLSIGVNNLEFGAVMEFCVTTGAKQTASWNVRPESYDATRCEERRVKGLAPTQSFRVDKYREDPRGKTVAERVADAQMKLPKRFPALAVALAAPVARGGIAAPGTAVFAASYPDFSRDSSGATCDTDPRKAVERYTAARLPVETWAWLGRQSEILNAKVASGARSTWTVVPISPAFKMGGYCAEPSYFTSIGEAVAGYDLAGPFHPNGAGQTLEYENTLPLVCRRLFGNDSCTSAPPKPR